MLNTPNPSPWLTRWDRMQEHYLVARDERFAILARLVQATQDDTPLILDLGCGTGSVMVALLEAIPGSRAIGVDMDPTLLRLAAERLAVYGERAQVIWADLRQAQWLEEIGRGQARMTPDKNQVSASSAFIRVPYFDAIVSATALHWMAPEQLAALYTQIASLLRPGGIFLNADHVACDNPLIQKTWEQHRAQNLSELSTGKAMPRPDDWDSFWAAYLAELGPEAAAERHRILGPWNGVESGQPLAWHLDQLRKSGFTSVDCFWRCNCDAIYGGIVKRDA